MTALAKVRAFVAPRPKKDVCELCADGLTDGHGHLIEPEHRRLSCVCRACALLFPLSGDGRRLRIESWARRISDLEIDDATWAALGVPVGLAFFYGTQTSEDVIATFPGPAGTVEATVPRAAWNQLCGISPAIAALAPDTEALLVFRTARRRHYFQVSIDHCYALAGLLRDANGPLSMIDPEIVESFFASLDRGVNRA